jgi:hypothetical protein
MLMQFECQLRSQRLQGATRPADLAADRHISQPCDKQGTSNRIRCVLLRPHKNGRLGAEPDTAIYLEPLGDSGRFFSFRRSTIAKPNRLLRRLQTAISGFL